MSKIEVSTGLLNFGEIDRAATLAAVAGEHMLLTGPPGGAKSLFYRKFFAQFEGRFFETQLSKFSDDSALFGAPDLKRMRETGEIIYPKRGIADAEWVGIDEIFDGSDICLRTLNGWLNERLVLRGSEVYGVPLNTCIATANYTRSNEIIAAVIDRFAISAIVPLLNEEQRIKLYDGMDFEFVEKTTAPISLEMLQEVRDKAKHVNIAATLIKTLVRWAKAQGFSPRRERVMAKLLKVNAALHGRTEVGTEDISVVRWVMPMHGIIAAGGDPSKDLLDGINRVLNESKQIAMIDNFRNVKRDAGDRTLTYVKNLAQAIKLIRDIPPVSDDVSLYQTSIVKNLETVHKEQLNELGVLV